MYFLNFLIIAGGAFAGNGRRWEWRAAARARQADQVLRSAAPAKLPKVAQTGFAARGRR